MKKYRIVSGNDSGWGYLALQKRFLYVFWVEIEKEHYRVKGLDDVLLRLKAIQKFFEENGI